MPASVTCIVKTFPHAEAIAARLQQSGLSACKVSVPSSCRTNRSVASSRRKKDRAKISEGIAMGAIACSVSGGVFGYMAGMGDLALPAFTHVAEMGGTLGTLAGVTVGTLIGGTVGALLGRHVPDPPMEWNDPEQTMRKYLLSVVIRDGQEENRAKHIIQNLGGEAVETCRDGAGSN